MNKPSSAVAGHIDSIEDSQIIEVLRLAQERTDIIPLWLGESCFATDTYICNEATKYLNSGHTFYTPNRGVAALRDSIRSYYERIYQHSVPDNRVCVTNSAMHAITMITTAVITPGDNAVLITPCWPNVDRSIRLAGGEVREAPLELVNGAFSLDLDKLIALCDDKTRVIYLASPSNPTGWVIDEAQARALLEFTRQRGIALISDEVYQRLSFGSEYGSTFLTLSEPDDLLFVVNSFSKAWSMTGWRLGWVIYPEGLTDIFEKLTQFTISGSPAFIQMAAVAALEHGEASVFRLKQHCLQAKEMTESYLSDIAGVEVFPSQGGFYSMFRSAQTEDSLAFCKQAALSAGVGLAPGVAFGAGGEGKVRLCYAKELPVLEQALGRLQPQL